MIRRLRRVLAWITSADLEEAYARGYQDALREVERELTALRHEASVLFAGDLYT